MNNNFNYNIKAKQHLTKMHTCFKNMTAFNHQFMSDIEWMYNRQKLRQGMITHRLSFITLSKYKVLSQMKYHLKDKR